MGDVERVKRMVASCIRKFGTTDPFEIADQLGVLYQIGNYGLFYGFEGIL